MRPNVASFFEPETFLQMMHMLGAFQVGHAADGSRLTPPPNLLDRGSREPSPPGTVEGKQP